ncbi:thiol-disulfide oxidoreductase ResA [Metasolibacillus sp. FSL H7-0170]|uniref:thiol-disulfide oxidoreductase ResA n=1 Tax=Metasolibacillus TaxID=2703677 RepID=UPI000793C2B8|nr:thiol-disulfide oxidoreductase ResA [Metasolibacillus fluoroglycofenilyticus]KYG89064.1 thiol-disulfide oxidoreductase [[Bacillus] sp. KCTC 13219]
MEKKKKRSIMRGIILGVLLAAIVYTVYTTATKDKVEMLKEGSKAPDFELVDLNGETHRLSDYEGKGVFLNFWGTWCPPCEREMPAMDRQYDAYKSQGVEMLAVNIAQSDFEVQRFISNLGVDFPVVIDKTRSVQKAYNVGAALPATILVTPDGKVKKIITGEMSEADIASYMESIKPE